MTSYTPKSTEQESPPDQAADHGTIGHSITTGGQLDFGLRRTVTGSSTAPENDTRGKRSLRIANVQHLPSAPVDASLLRKACELADCIDPIDEFNTPLYLTALSGTIMEMWESAQHSDSLHQDILASLENAVRQSAASGSVSVGQIDAFREALGYLAEQKLVREHADVVRSRIVMEGFAPLGFAE